MIPTSRLKKILIGESYLKYYYPSPDTFYRLATTIKNMNETQLKELDKKHHISKRYNVLSEGILSSFISLSGLIFQTPLWVPYRALKGATSKCVRRCGSFSINTDRRKDCILNCKLIELQKSLAIARQAQTYCNNSTDRLSCLKKTEKVIRKISNEIIDIKLQISEVQMNID